MATVLIVGAGPGVGKATADVFSAAGYKVAVASRTQKLDPKYPHFTFDASKPETVAALFEAVSASVGVPSVVVYNAYGGFRNADYHPLTQDVDGLKRDMNVNAISAYAAAQETIKGFEKLGPSGLGPAGGTFVFVGNGLNVFAVPGFTIFSMQKGATSHLIHHLALAEYQDKPYKFYYIDERKADGTYVPRGLNHVAHAETALELAKDPKQRAWDYTFVAGKGYVNFPRVEYLPWKVE